jgi:hypothetical protein
VISKLFAARGYGRPQADRQLHDLWKRAAGEEIARSTRVLGLKNAVLQIGVANSALLSELASFRKQELLARLKEQDKQLKLRDMKFQLRGDLT